MTLGQPHEHLPSTPSTNAVAIERARAGAPTGLLVTTDEQTAGRGRQGRSWSAPPGALALSVLVEGDDPLLPLRAGLAVARACGQAARVKWPNDVLVGGRKVAGILVESAGDGRAVVGIGVNAAVAPEDLPDGLAAGTLGLDASQRAALLEAIVGELGGLLDEPGAAVVAALGARDALVGRPVRWRSAERGAAEREGTAEGITPSGRLRVRTAAGELVELVGGEVHLL